MEDDYPDILFAKDGEIYELAGKRAIVIGGAYSVDKQVRIRNSWGWWADEQPSDEIMFENFDAFGDREISFS